MKLLITRGDRPSVWKIDEDNRASQMIFKAFGEHDLQLDLNMAQRSALPYELVEKIMIYLFKSYLETCNFDLCTDLLFFSRAFTRLIYGNVYDIEENLGFNEMYTRLVNTFLILQNIYDDFLTASARLEYPLIKLTSTQSPMNTHEPWDFFHDVLISSIPGMVIDLTESCEQVRYGELYGETVVFYGRHERGYFEASQVKTPVLNFKFVDVMDTLLFTEDELETKNFYGFFNLMKKAFGKSCGIFVMVKEDEDVDNPFIASSDLFYEFE